MQVTLASDGAARFGLEVIDPTTLEAPDGPVDVAVTIYDQAGDELVATLEPLDGSRYAIRFLPPIADDYRVVIGVTGAVEAHGETTITVS